MPCLYKCQSLEQRLRRSSKEFATWYWFWRQNMKTRLSFGSNKSWNLALILSDRAWTQHTTNTGLSRLKSPFSRKSCIAYTSLEPINFVHVCASTSFYPHWVKFSADSTTTYSILSLAAVPPTLFPANKSDSTQRLAMCQSIQRCSVLPSKWCTCMRIEVIMRSRHRSRTSYSARFRSQLYQIM